jgi:hypothetical protein|tara:strand:+ start:977 stop:1111 length:135 start_codon:yes stop_codon:yes gene_type:complete
MSIFLALRTTAGLFFVPKKVDGIWPTRDKKHQSHPHKGENKLAK